VPITVISPVGGGIGPGVEIQLESDFIGPINAGQWDLTVIPQGEEIAILEESHDDDGRTLSTPLGWKPKVGVVVPRRTVPDGTNVRLVIVFHDNPATFFETETVTDLAWHSTSAIAPLVQELAAQSTVTGGFTQTDRELLMAIQSATQVPLLGLPVQTTLPLANFFQFLPLDVLTTQSLSGGVTCDPVVADISLSFFAGVQVAIASYPPEWIFRTPDEAWGFHDLAVLSFWRGGQLLKRLGIHTTSFTEQPLPGQLLPWAVRLANVPIIPPDYQIHVDWAAGVCGELRGLAIP
jgi:hypothetical protein